MYFGTSFGAEDEVRLTPFEDDKPKVPKILFFRQVQMTPVTLKEGGTRQRDGRIHYS